MSTTHVGKIGRLPKGIREELGRRIEDGGSGQELVAWLNSVPEVKEVLQAQFDGRLISEDNLSKWRQDGHREWVRAEENREFASGLAEQSDDLEERAPELGERAARVLTAELARLTLEVREGEENPEKRLVHLHDLSRFLSRLRRDECRAARLVLAQEQWGDQVQREHDEEMRRMKEEHKKQIRGICFGALHKPQYAELFGGGKKGRKLAEMLFKVENDLPLDKPGSKARRGKKRPPEPEKSQQI